MVTSEETIREATEVTLRSLLGDDLELAPLPDVAANLVTALVEANLLRQDMREVT